MKCKNCKYFNERKGIKEINASIVGQCQRFPPTPLLVPGQIHAGSQPSLAMQSFFPPVTGDQYCGEFDKGHE